MLPEALPYHLKVRDYFRGHTSTWEFFAAVRAGEEQSTASRTDLLKNTYPFSREGEPGLFVMIDRARAALALTDLPVEVYRADAGPGNELNAGTFYFNREVLLVLTGQVLQKLDDEELLAVIVKELARIRLYTLWNGELEITDRIIRAIANHPQSDPVCLETARRFSLYCEIYCDRCAYAITGDPKAVTGMIRKLATGLTGLSAGSHIRTQALQLWHREGEAAAPEITAMVDGVPDLERLDLLVQQELKELTYDFLQEFLRPVWMRTKAITGLQQQYFPHEETRAGRLPEQLAAVLAGTHPDIRTYFGYVLLDFALADPSLEEMPAARALEFAGEVQISEVYDTICKKELQLNDKKWQQQKEKLLKAYSELSKD